MAIFLTAFLTWFLFYIIGWATWRQLPGNKRPWGIKEICKPDHRLILLTNILFLLALLVCLILHKSLFGDLHILSLSAGGTIRLLLALTLICFFSNAASAFGIRGQKARQITTGFLAISSFYLANTFLQQVLTFGLLLEGINSILPPAITVIATSTLFGLAHFLSLLEQTSFKESLLIVVGGLMFGVIFSVLRLWSRSIIPGFLLHFNFYLFLNGPLFYLLKQKSHIDKFV